MIVGLSAAVVFTPSLASAATFSSYTDAFQLSPLTISVNDLVSRQKTNTIANNAITNSEIVSWNSWVVNGSDENVEMHVGASEDLIDVGILKPGSAGLILERSGYWLKIRSGSREGWVNEELVLTGAQAYTYALQTSASSVKALHDDTPLYSSGLVHSKTDKALKKDMVLPIADQSDISNLTPFWSTASTASDWIAVNYAGKTYYVAADDVATGLPLESSSAVPKKSKRQAEKDLDKHKTQLMSFDLRGKCDADVLTYMGWRCITNTSSKQYQLLSQFESYDSNGFGKIGNRYVIACSPLFGEIGDLLDVKFANGTVLHAIIGDHKNLHDDGANIWGHQHGRAVIEFVVNKASWYGGHKNILSYHPEWSGRVNTIANYGNIWDSDDANVASLRERARRHAQEVASEAKSIQAEKKAEKEKKKEEKQKKAEEKKKAAAKKKAQERKRKKAEEKRRKAREKQQRQNTEQEKNQKKHSDEKNSSDQTDNQKSTDTDSGSQNDSSQNTKNGSQSGSGSGDSNTTDDSTNNSEQSGSNSGSDSNSSVDSSAPAE